LYKNVFKTGPITLPSALKVAKMLEVILLIYYGSKFNSVRLSTECRLSGLSGIVIRGIEAPRAIKPVRIMVDEVSTPNTALLAIINMLRDTHQSPKNMTSRFGNLRVMRNMTGHKHA
jgi:hypothetical protein